MAFRNRSTTTGAAPCPPGRGRAADAGLLALRLTAGGILAGHGAQKLFGAFGGHGLAGTAGWLESLGLRPGKTWAALAGLSEFGGGTLMALGLGGPVGPIAIQGAMATATRQAHWNKPIWVSEGGAELPAVYSATGIALMLAGPGRYSLDRAFGLKVPTVVAAVVAAGVAAGVILTETQTAAATAESPSPEEAVMEGPEGGQDHVVPGQAGTAAGEDRLVAATGGSAEAGSPSPGEAEIGDDRAETIELTDLVP